jgi:hypothetical protein
MSNVIMASLSIVNPVAEPSSKPTSNHLLRPLAATVLIGAAALLLHRLLGLGATRGEQHGTLVGDDILPAPDVSTTRAISIAAAADDVWPWLAQLGQGRGGFYSYDWLENLIPGMDIRNADRIVPEWQQITVGAEVRLAPEVALSAVALEPGRALVLRGSVPMGRVAPPYEFTWAFVLLPQSGGTTRFVVRERYAYTRRWAALIVRPAALVSGLMSPKMLRGIKSRAEHRPGISTPAAELPQLRTAHYPIPAAG